MNDWHVTAERRHVVVPRGGGLAPLVIQCVINLNADAKDRSAPVGSWWWWVDSVEPQDENDDTSCGDVPTAADARAACDARLATRWGYVAGGEESKGRAVSLRRVTVKEAEGV